VANVPDGGGMPAAAGAELVHIDATAAAISDRPGACRFPRGEGVGVELPQVGVPLEIGKGRMIQQGERVAILSFGARLQECLKAAENLTAKGLRPTIADARFAKPLDHDLIRDLAQDHEVLITIEEGSIGGFGSHVMHFLAEEGLLETGLNCRSIVLADTFIDQDRPAAMYETAKLSAADIEAKVLATLGVASVANRRA